MTDEQANQVLDIAIKKLRGGWVRNILAVDAWGESTTPTDPSAASFCAIGALIAAINEVGVSSTPIDGRLLNRIERPLTYGIVDFNNREAKNVHEVIAAFEQAKVDV